MIDGNNDEEKQVELLDGIVKDPVLEVFEFWKAMMTKERSQLGAKRKTAITAALRMGYAVDDLRLAIVGCKFDAWSQGQNDRQRVFDDIELICRDETKIDLFIDLGNEYMRRAQRKDQQAEVTAADEPKRTTMPDYVREKLDALFSKHRGKP